MCHFIAIHEFKLELSSGSAQIVAKLWIFQPLWSWNSTDDLKKQKGTSSIFYVTWKLCASFHSHLWSKLELQSRNSLIWVKIVDFSASVILKFDGGPLKTIGHLFYATKNFVHHFVAICELKLEIRSGNARIGTKFVLTSSDLDLWPPAFAWASLLSNHLWKLHDDTMTGTLSKKVWWTDRQTARQPAGRPKAFIELLGRS